MTDPAPDGGRLATVRSATPADLEQLPGVEARADELFLPLGISDLPAPAGAAERARAWRVLVAPAAGADDVVAGFAVLELVDGAVHLDQLSVDPAHGRQGHGSRLLAAAVAAAADHGADRVTLTTFAEVPWNGPFYARHGWVPLTSPTPGLAALRAHETALGLDRHGPRTAMVRRLTTEPGGDPPPG